jgi:conjugal transfer pilus assembly protein TraW
MVKQIQWIGLFLMLSLSVEAKDFGTLGHTFEIVEDDLFEVIQGKLKALEDNGSLLAHQEDMQQKAIEKIKRPEAVLGLAKTTKHRIFDWDPSIGVPYDLSDHRRQIFAKAGTRINPLDYLSLKKRLLFIDGDDEAQVQWALQDQAKIILVKGSPLALSDQYSRHFYFDQGGTLVKKFGIQQVPAQIFQKDKILKVEELVLEEPS